MKIYEVNYKGAVPMGVGRRPRANRSSAGTRTTTSSVARTATDPHPGTNVRYVGIGFLIPANIMKEGEGKIFFCPVFDTDTNHGYNVQQNPWPPSKNIYTTQRPAHGDQPAPDRPVRAGGEWRVDDHVVRWTAAAAGLVGLLDARRGRTTRAAAAGWQPRPPRPRRMAPKPQVRRTRPIPSWPSTRAPRSCPTSTRPRPAFASRTRRASTSSTPTAGEIRRRQADPPRHAPDRLQRERRTTSRTASGTSSTTTKRRRVRQSRRHAT